MKMLVRFKNKKGNIPRPNDSNLVLQVTSHHVAAAMSGRSSCCLIVRRVDMLQPKSK
jgi:hypothetical protein